MDSLAPFDEAIQVWFERRFPLGPTEPQTRGWPAIAAGHDTLIAAPTGSGKTLAAFLVCIDRFYQRTRRPATGFAGPLFQDPGGRDPSPFQSDATTDDGTNDGTEDKTDDNSRDAIKVVYISPLKALAADIHQNLQEPLAEIAKVAAELGRPVPEIQVALRSGDTPASARARMLRNPPDILITTPESLYLLVTAEKSRALLHGVETVIVDEIHAVARDKRGSHLALTLERLDALCEKRPARIGLSATQRPIETVARLLVGAGAGRSHADGRARCEIIDAGHTRKLDLALELPNCELEAVASAEQVADMLDKIASLVESRQTTLVFVNTRRMAERIAHQISDRLGDDAVAAHHGSLSKERRLRVETQLRAGELKVLVATASLELGIDIGPIELVCQIGSPRSFATFLQRVGRSGHCRGGVPVGRLFPMTRDELVECAALLRGVRAHELDALLPPVAPLDILAQQIVAACGAEDWEEDALYALMRRAAPFAELSRQDFDEVVEFLSEGIMTGRGRRAAYLHRDRIAGMLRGRRGARLAALTSGGAIPENANYRVIAGSDETLVGTVDEDWAIESMAGDIFLLGSTSWQIKRIESGVVRVVDAGGAPPTIPFWFGEAPARTAELSRGVSELRRQVCEFFSESQHDRARTWLREACGINAEAADQIVRYLAAAYQALGGRLPTQQDVIFERFFDDTGGMQLIVHAPFGGRVNRGLGLALRKRFCVNFDFELQAAANDDAVVLSLGPQHSFPLDTIPRFLHSNTVAEVLSQAVLVSPMFTARWRWNLNRALSVLRMRGGKRNPPPIQRMEADDLMASVFPRLAACQENTTGPVEIPDHPLVRQTMHDCLTEAMDIDGLREMVRGFESGTLGTHFVDSSEPSPLCHEIVNGRPFTFLDDAPLEERRTRAISLRRGLPVEARELAKLDAEAIARVREEARPTPRDPDELHDLLLSSIALRPCAAWQQDFESLVDAGRASRLHTEQTVLWVSSEKREAARAVYPDAEIEPCPPLPPALTSQATPDPDALSMEIVRGVLEYAAVIKPSELAHTCALPIASVEAALARLEAEGYALRGHFEDPQGPEQFCARRLLARIHRYTQARLRSEIEPVTAKDLMRFLLRWQHATKDTQREGRAGVAAVVEQLQGFEAGAGLWEEVILPARVDRYRSSWLDSLCLSGDVVWGRLSLMNADTSDAEKGSDPQAETEEESGKSAGRGAAAPSRVTPMSFTLRGDLPWLLQAARGENRPRDPGPGSSRDILECLRARGALFHSDLTGLLGRLPVEVEEGLWGLFSRGFVTADGFQAVRSLLGARERWARTRARARARRGLRRGSRSGNGAAAEGRWSLLPEARPAEEPDELAEAVAEQLLARWGVVFRELMARENITLPWREILWALRRLEARGVIRGGRFVSGFVGEQYALPEAVDQLRKTRRRECKGEVVRLSATDPLNLVGIITEGPRVPALRSNTVIYRDGLPVTQEELSASAPAQDDSLGGERRA